MRTDVTQHGPRRGQAAAPLKRTLVAIAVAIALSLLLCAAAQAQTAAPTLTSPTPDEVVEGSFDVTYTLPEEALSGSVELIFQSAAIGNEALTLSEVEAGTHTIEVQSRHPLQVVGVESAPTELPEGEYTLVVVYENELGEAAATSTASTIHIVRLPLCAPGAFSASGEQPCEEAPAGDYAAGEGATVATPCPPGTYNPTSGATSISACMLDLPGYFSAAGAEVARPCELGTFAASYGSDECAAARPGYYVEVTAASSATPCPAGTSNPTTGAKSSVACVSDPPGYFSASGAVTATPCQAGRYAALEGSEFCDLAPPGYYVDLSGAASAERCPPGTYSSAAGSTVCKPTPPNTYSAAGAREPTPCPAGTESPAGAAECTLIPKEEAPGSKAEASKGEESGSKGAPAGEGSPEGHASEGAEGGAAGQGAEAGARPPVGLKLAGPRRQASLRRSGRQRFRLTSAITGTVVVHASVLIVLAHRRVKLHVRAVKVECHAGKTLQRSIRVNITHAARRLLANRHAHVVIRLTAAERTSSERHAVSKRLYGRR